ncbi:DEAD/DEAH box helicase [Actinomadura sp. HBU206391]|uniref:DEAD/DEAH box helicase n=1 Tax=Actinomadura sp. HBU206391 TaxID=2731692 RepID=UPI00164EEBBB|nr:DEAD/DEAH box helicase family protein [Actinomadura sp. HBU206391]MBC6461366.1 DEAD/DEAH box helicase family protein [Actinomadura sp. HBU206391]
MSSPIDAARWPGELRPYQEKALRRLDAGWAEGRSRAWVVLPPGSGKTLVGLEAARRLGRKTVVFVPNTAIQNQWADHWARFGGAAGTSRELGTDVSVLTYQSLAVFDADAETDEEGHQKGLLRRLHDNGHELIAALRAAGPVTLVLDECHHLLDVWGRLLAEVLKQLPDALVIGLTATPPESLTPEEARLVDTLFGVPILGASIPALVRQGYLAPFTELAWLTTPTSVEASYIAGEAERFAELTTDLLRPDFATTGFLTWLDLRLVTRSTSSGEPVAWDTVAKGEPLIAAAALRFHHAGLLDLPDGARLREEHRHAPSAEDWVALLNDYVKHCLLPSEDARDAEAVAAVKRALPAVGYQLTRRGIRSARSPVDRVLARSAAKTHGAVEIVSTEAASLGGRLRCLVLCDHERAGATLPARLRDVLDAEAGSAWLMLENLVADPRTGPLNPVLVTGRTVAAAEETARGLIEAVACSHPGLVLEPAGRGIVRITGPWTSRTWVAAVTAYFEEGRCQVLVGTRALLGEGWDARGVNALIDLTTSTTPTSVVQTRGRAVRLDPTWPDKAANTWTVVCVSDRHPKGAADWNRFVRKHDGYLVATPDGEIMSGVAHVDAAFSPYAPPAVETLDAINAAMLTRADDREATRAAWRLGTPFRDELVHTLRIRPVRAERAPVPAADVRPVPPPVLPAENCATPTPSWWSGGPADPVETWWVASAGVLLLCGITGLGLVGAGVRPSALPELIAAVIAILGMIGVGWGVTVRLPQGRAARILETVAPEPSVTRFAYAVADALVACGLSRRGAEGVEVRTEPGGGYRFSLADVDTATSERFALALDEVLAPVTSPRYLVPRYVVRLDDGARARRRRARAWLRGKARADGVVYHAVPSVFGQNRQRTTAFVAAWNRWVSGGSAVYAGSAEGAGVMATHRGADPFAATTVLRVAWD